MSSAIMMVATSTGGTESSLAAIDAPQSGRIVGVEWACNTDFDTDNDNQLWQLSFGSTFSQANDSRQVISNISLGSLTFTAGGSVIGLANGFTAMDIIVQAGERLFLHSSAAAAVVGTARATVHFDFDEARAAVRRR